MDFYSLQNNEYAQGWTQPRPVSFSTLDPERQWMSSAPILQLPDEMLEAIVGYLPQSDLSSLALVNSDCRFIARPFQFCDIKLARASSRTLRLLQEVPDTARSLPIALYVRMIRLEHGNEKSDTDLQLGAVVALPVLISSMKNLVAFSYSNHQEEPEMIDLDTLAALSSTSIRQLHLSNVKFQDDRKQSTLSARMSAAKIDMGLVALVLDKVEVHAAYILAKRSSSTLQHFTLKKNIQYEELPNGAHASIFARGSSFPELTSLCIARGPSLPGSYLVNLQKNSPQLKSIRFAGPLDHGFQLRDKIPSLKHCSIQLGYVDMLPQLRSVFISNNSQLTALEISTDVSIGQRSSKPDLRGELMERWTGFLKNISSALPRLTCLRLSNPHIFPGDLFNRNVLEIIATIKSLRQLTLDGLGPRPISVSDLRTSLAPLVNLEWFVLCDNIRDQYRQHLMLVKEHMCSLGMSKHVLRRHILFNRLLGAGPMPMCGQRSPGCVLMAIPSKSTSTEKHAIFSKKNFLEE